jgi:hypothetical protein
MRKQKVEAKKVSEMEKPRSGWNGIPACVREELRIRGRAFYSDCVSSHGSYLGVGDRIFSRITGLWQEVVEANRDQMDLLILIVSAYCSGLRCSRFNLN